jgi:hypothetical protein
MTSRINRTSPSPRSPSLLGLASCTITLVAVASGVFATNTRAQEIGYSYMRLEIGGHPVTNFVHNPKYQGWIQVEEVEAMPGTAVKKANAARASGDRSKSAENVKPPWTALPKILVSGRAGAGEIRFGAGETMTIDKREGSLDPLWDAQKQKTIIDSAELDLYDFETNKFVGKYRLKGIRVLSLEDIPASACAMYQVTMNFQSIEKI